MGPRDNRTGAAPVAELARLDSDVHHIRDQADTDRRTEAAFRLETRNQLQQIESAQASTAGQVMRVSDLVNRLDVASTSHTAQLGDIRLELAASRGAVKIIAAVVVVTVPLIGEVLRHVLR
jgi:hypothetical protein